jgi:hypothetical protein
MSENLNRSSQDFSKYDSMSIGELEEILRADVMGPERDDSDVDEILYVMEVLAKKRRQNGIAGKTALEAYQEFQQHYLPRPAAESKPSRKDNIIPFKRIAAVAASLVLVFSLATSANALCFKDVWNAVVTWAQETFSFSMGVEISEPTPNDNTNYLSLYGALSKGDINTPLVPQWFPSNYYLENIVIDETPQQKTYLGLYCDGEKKLKVFIQSYMQGFPEQIEVNDTLIEIYSVSDTDYYIIQNNGLIQAAWITESFECYIAGEITVEEIKLMIDSIEKG